MKQLTESHKAHIREGMRRSTKHIGRPRIHGDVKCEACGKTFTALGNRGKAHFCSRSCYRAGCMRGPNHPNWNPSGRFKGHFDGQPYQFVRSNGAWKLEHVVIAEATLGRKLRRGEVVHHTNGDGLDNRRTNLLICTQAYHAALHARMVRAWMREHLTGEGER